MKTVVNPGYVKNSQVWWCPTWVGQKGYNAYGNPDGGSMDFVLGHGCCPHDTGCQEVMDNFVITSPWDWDGNHYSEMSVSDPTSYMLLFCGSPWAGGPCGSLASHTGADNECNFITGHSAGGTTILYADGHTKFRTFTRQQWDKWYEKPRNS